MRPYANPRALSREYRLFMRQSRDAKLHTRRIRARMTYSDISDARQERIHTEYILRARALTNAVSDKIKIKAISRLRSFRDDNSVFFEIERV